MNTDVVIWKYELIYESLRSKRLSLSWGPFRC